jgi:uncharacterized protein with PIN domain
MVDASAPAAILQRGPERRRFDEAIEAAERHMMSATSFVETVSCKRCDS